MLLAKMVKIDVFKNKCPLINELSGDSGVSSGERDDKHFWK